MKTIINNSVGKISGGSGCVHFGDEDLSGYYYSKLGFVRIYGWYSESGATYGFHMIYNHKAYRRTIKRSKNYYSSLGLLRIAGRFQKEIISEKNENEPVIKNDYGFTVRKSTELCKDPLFADKKLHHCAILKDFHIGSSGDIDEGGMPGWISKVVCTRCGKNFGNAGFYPDAIKK